MFVGNSEILLQRTPWRKDIEYVIFGKYSTDGKDKPKYSYVSRIEFTNVEPNEPIKPTGIISEIDAQHLIDQLWNCGLRPSEGAGSAGSLKATQNHLEDMRKIAFDLLREGKCQKK